MKPISHSRRSIVFGILGILLCAPILAAGRAEAATIKIVALGASFTAGKGVGEASAFPAQLEAMLRAKGYDASVVNEGVNGNDTSQMRARMNSVVPDGTMIVILETPKSNDQETGANTAANMAAMQAALRHRHIASIVIPIPPITGLYGMANFHLLPNRHPTVEGQHAIAAHILPRVIALIDKRH